VIIQLRATTAEYICIYIINVYIVHYHIIWRDAAPRLDLSDPEKVLTVDDDDDNDGNLLLQALCISRAVYKRLRRRPTAMYFA